jgi:hypothetical protein
MRLDAMHSFAEELRMTFRVTHGVMGAENAMARELIALNLRMLRMEDRIRDLERDRLRSFHREPSIHYMRTHRLPIDDDDWFTPEMPVHERE